MSSEIKAPPTNPPVTGTVYALVGDATIWNGSAWVTDSDANRATAGIGIPLVGGWRIGDFPVSITVAGTYPVVLYKRAGGSRATTDTAYWEGSIQWDGTKEVTPGTVINRTTEIVNRSTSVN